MTNHSATSFRHYQDTARSFAMSRVPPQTLGDLIQLIERREGRNHQLAMLRATAAHISNHLEKGPDRIPLGELLNLRPRLRLYLEKRALKRNSVRSYVNFLRILLRKACKFGWSEHLPEIEESWRGIQVVLSRTRSRRIVDYAIRMGKTPAEFTDEDLNHWADGELQVGRHYEYVQHVKTTFWKHISRAGLGGHLPRLSIRSRQNYGVPIDQLPEPMRTELTEVLDWKTAAFAVGRSNKSRHRPITALHLRRFICRLYGFVHNELGKDVKTLRSLLAEEDVSHFTEWCVNHRKLATPSLASWLGMIPPLGAHRSLRGMDFSYVRSLVAALPIDPEGRIRDRKARKWVEYDILAEIPSEITKSAQKVDDPKRKASLVRNALIVKWLLVEPWRQRNIRQALLGTQDSGANIFFEEVHPLSTMDKPRWVEEALKSNPHEKFWRFNFGLMKPRPGAESMRSFLDR